MSDDYLYDLVIEWDERRQRGEEVSPELLCEDRPDLLPELEDRIVSVRETDWMFDSDADEDDDFLSLPDFATVMKHSDETQLPSSTLSVQDFARAVADSGLLTSDEVENAQALSSADGAQSLARELVSTDKLTTYQASVLLEGRSSPLLLDRYVILDTLDSGGMGLVFKALHRSLDRIVALKTLPPAAVDSPDKVKRFQREARAAAKLNHANIVTTHDAHESDGVHFLVMEYVKGKDLNKVVKENGPLPVGKAVNCILQAARGLEHAHKQGIIHRDIKPANLLLDEDGVVKVLDMGLARIEAGDDEKTVSRELTMAGTVMGTVAYMSPEQAADSTQADHRSDIYSLGCTLYFLLTGKPPYQEGTSVKTIFAHRDKAVPALGATASNVPEELIAVYHRMLAKKPGDRFQSMTEVISALEELEIEDDEEAQPVVAMSPAMHETATFIDTSRDVIEPQPGSGSFDPTKRRWGLIAAGLLGFIVLLAGLIIKPATKSEYTWPKNQPAPAKAPFNAEQAKAHQEEWAKHLGTEVETTNSIGMKFRVIPPGEFLMGSSEEEIVKLLEEAEEQKLFESYTARIPTESPQHRVALSKPFGMSIYEVTRGHFRQFVDATGYKTDAEKYSKSGFGYYGNGGFGYKDGQWVQAPEFLWNTNLGFDTEQTDDHPVVNISWDDAVAFCEWLSKEEGVTYRLPTEAEWEFACRAGSLARFSFGNEESKLGEYAWYGSQGGRNTKPVGKKAANALGLFDLHGNVWEWCGDRYGPYTTTPAVDPLGSKEGSSRLLRGGSFNVRSSYVRSALRISDQPSNRTDNIGFRIVRTFEKYKPKSETGIAPKSAESSKLESTKTLDSEESLEDLRTLESEKKLDEK